MAITLEEKAVDEAGLREVTGRIAVDFGSMLSADLTIKDDGPP